MQNNEKAQTNEKVNLLLTQVDQVFVCGICWKASYIQVCLTEFVVAVATLRRLGVGGMLLTGRARTTCRACVAGRAWWGHRSYRWVCL